MSDDNTTTAISVHNLSKTFKLPHEKSNSIKSLLLSFRKRRTYETQQALKKVSFEVKEGEFFGIVGRNGSGKSTLLKLLAGIYTPTKGTVNVNGKLTPFIELGVGFNPELTGRENVFLNGALLGFNRKEMNELYDQIVEFAELERFMDQKLKNYSSGMQVRLAFSIAIRAKSDILVLDEVLAVGDEAFQQKCIDVFEEHKANKQTIVLVTHNMEMVRRFCTRAMLIDNGIIKTIGKPSEIASEYSRVNEDVIIQELNNSNSQQQDSIIATIMNAAGKESSAFRTKDTAKIVVRWPADLSKEVKNVGIAIVKQSGEYIYGANTFDTGIKITQDRLEYEVKLSLGPGKYYLMIGLFGKTEEDVIKFIDHGPQFFIKESTTKELGLARLDSRWGA